MSRTNIDRQNSTIDIAHNHGIDIKNRIIYVSSETYGADGDETSLDYAMAVRFIKNLDYLNSLSQEPIMVKTLTRGGDWFYGMAMFDAVLSSPAPIDIHASAYATSMSSIFLQSARERILSKHTTFMVHYGDYGDTGDLRKCMSGMKYYQTLNKPMFDIYASRCVGAEGWGDKSAEQISLAIEKKIDKAVDWWMSAVEALHFGFCDRIE